MGDGSMHRPTKNNTNPRVEASMINKEYLNYLDKKFKYYGRGVEIKSTPSESASSTSKSFDIDVNVDNYSTVYEWRTSYAPVFGKFAKWYSTGKKVFPENVILTPVVLKHWFVCDGHYDKNAWGKHIEIAVSNERKNKDKIENMFKRVGFRVNSWNTWENGAKIRFSKEESMKMFEYMGEPVKGFERKWPDRKI